MVGIWGVDSVRLVPSTWSSALQLVAGGMIIFLTYEGFQLIANTAQDVRDAARTFPRAFYSGVGFVIVLYVLVAVVTVGTLPVARIVDAKDYALAEAARSSLGQTGFLLIAIVAMLSTVSAINATAYGAARLRIGIVRMTCGVWPYLLYSGCIRKGPPGFMTGAYDGMGEQEMTRQEGVGIWR